jgi:hypothetical protein
VGIWNKRDGSLVYRVHDPVSDEHVKFKVVDPEIKEEIS